MRSCVSLLSLALIAGVQAQTVAQFESHLKSDRSAYIKAMKTKDMKYFEAVATKDFVSTEGPRQMDRKQSLQAIASSFQMIEKYLSITYAPGKVSRQGKDFIWKGEMAYEMQLKGQGKPGPKMTIKIEATETWQNQAGKWRLRRIDMKTLEQTMDGKKLPPRG